jgi:hypothetical protein
VDVAESETVIPSTVDTSWLIMAAVGGIAALAFLFATLAKKK